MRLLLYKGSGKVDGLLVRKKTLHVIHVSFIEKDLKEKKIHIQMTNSLLMEFLM